MYLFHLNIICLVFKHTKNNYIVKDVFVFWRLSSFYEIILAKKCGHHWFRLTSTSDTLQTNTKEINLSLSTGSWTEWISGGSRECQRYWSESKLSRPECTNVLLWENQWTKPPPSAARQLGTSGQC